MYGEWIMLTAIPSYLSLTDMGFGSVAGNDMAMRVAAADRKGAVETFQSTLLLLLVMSLVAALIVAPLLWGAPLDKWLHITSLDSAQTRLIVALLSIYSLCTLHSSLLGSAFRSDGKYALIVSYLNVIRLLENAGMLLVLYRSGSPLYVAVTVASIRTVGTGSLYLLLKYQLSWIRLGVSNASLRRLRDLTRPAIAFMAFPAGNGLSIQGMTVVIGLMLGPVSVAAFNSMRTLSRFAYQIIDSIKNSVWPELSAAYGAQNWPLARRLHRSCCQIAFWLSMMAVAVLAMFGPKIFRLWTHQRVAIDIPCFYVLLIVVIASSLWNTSSAVAIAANLHERLAVQYLFGTAAALFLAYVLMPHLQLVGPAVALLATDIWMDCFVIRSSNHLLKDDTNDFIYSMLRCDRLKLLVAR
jgi:O-antigen/teichoic acid export membrane protein